MDFVEFNMTTSSGSPTTDTVTEHLIEVWAVSGSFWNRNWEKIYDACDGDSYKLSFLGECLVMVSIGLCFDQGVFNRLYSLYRATKNDIHK